MDKAERKQLMDRINKYDKLNTQKSDIEEILKMPSYVKDKYGKQEIVRVNMSFTFGNGTTHSHIVIDENNSAFNELIKILSKEKELIEEQIHNL